MSLDSPYAQYMMGIYVPPPPPKPHVAPKLVERLTGVNESPWQPEIVERWVIREMSNGTVHKIVHRHDTVTGDVRITVWRDWRTKVGGDIISSLITHQFEGKI